MRRWFSALRTIPLVLGAVLLLSGCATAGIEAVNSLRQGPNSGSFDGLWRRAAVSPETGKREINILFFHGIGWTQQNENFARDFELALVRAHGMPEPAAPADMLICEASRDEARRDSAQRGLDRSPDYGGLRLLLSTEHRLETDLAGVTLRINEGGCLDRRVVDTPNIRYNLYRFFWDDLFWNAFQYAHLGYDDDVGARPDDLARLRLPRSRQLKDQIVTHGLSDAAMYIGPVGELMREAGRVALCAAARDSTSHQFFDAQSNRALIGPVGANVACDAANVRPGAFALVTESLGSRIAFDTLRESQGPDAPLIEMVMRQQPEVFMLANQLALVGLGDLHPPGSSGVAPTSHPGRIIALSEINDLLTYEIVPYVELLWTRSRELEGLPAEMTMEDRERLVSLFGFEVIDLRLRFAGPALGFIPTAADPMAAHSGHAENSTLMALMICGGQADENGRISASLDCIRGNGE